MARRERTVTFQCVETGCREFARYAAENREDEKRLYREYTGKWKCVRHTNPEGVLSVENRHRRTEFVAGKSERYPDLPGLYFGSSGFISGPGFKAWANDFPAGTRIVVTVDVVLPDDAADGEPKEKP